MIWKIPSCESGSASEIARVAKESNLSHVLIKIADGPYTYNTDKTTGTDLVPAVVSALKAKGLQVWGWHYVYGYNPTGEAQIAIKRVTELGLDGYVIDAESEYKLSGRDVVATTFMTALRKGLPNTPVALCSYRFPTYHPQFPWTNFLDKCDYNMPQVYWQAAHNPGDQLKRCVREFQAITPYRPIMPTGPVYSYGGWTPTMGEMIEFLQTVIALNLSSTNFFAWDYGRTSLTTLWNTIAQFPWSDIPSTTTDISQKCIDAFNTHNAATIAGLYTSDAVHITSSETIQGTSAIQNWYTNFLTNVLPNASFTLTGVDGTGTNRHFTWTATSSAGSIKNGSDTLGIVDGEITYHYTYYTVTK
jgi:ketosteroid isomerase-like protein